MSVRAVLAVAVLAVLAAGGAAAVFLASDRPQPARVVPLLVLVGLAFVGSGLVARVRRPDNRTGVLMILVGFAWFASTLTSSDASLLFTFGYAVGGVIAAVFVHLVLAFPSGRLEGTAERRVVAGMYVLAFVVQPAWLLFDDLHGLGCDECPDNAFLVAHVPALAAVFGVLLIAMVVGLFLAAFVLLVRRWRRASPPLRRVLAPVYLTAGATVVIAAVSNALFPFPGAVRDGLEVLTVVGLPAVPLAFLVGLLRGRLARAGVARLVVELGDVPAPGRLGEALGRALGDPSVDVAYALPDGTHVDYDGRPVALPPPGSGRVASVVERSGRRVAAILHDASLEEDRALVDAVVAAAGLALENERLQAELRARLADLRGSRARLVHVADTERRKIERDLHDGAQQRLVAISLSLAPARRRFASDAAVSAMLEQTSAQLADALAELRELARGIHPAVLTERGLGAAIESLISRAPVPVELLDAPAARLPSGIEAAAYYLVAEALTNVAKYAEASSAQVCVSRVDGSVVVEVADDGKGGADARRGSGLRGLVDRVEALDGRLDVDSPPGAGTRIRATIPMPIL